MYCKYCGKQIKDGVKFCPFCGKRLAAAQTARLERSLAQPVLAVPRKQGPGKTGWAVIGVVCAAAAIIILLLVFSGSGGLNIGQPQTLAQAVIPAGGGVITVSDSGTALDGMEITVPDGAYAYDTPFVVTTSAITSGSMGELFNPITPLISIENGGEFADEPMTVKIPIQKSGSEFAMAFGYDRATGELEGIPFAEEDNTHITIVTAHFSDFVVSKVDKARISGEPDSSFAIDSGFEPGKDDFEMPNHGSVLHYGHCAGQSIAELYYYSKRGRIGWDEQLYGRFDNNGQGATPDLYWDDAKAMRLCSVEQTVFNAGWIGYVNKKDEDTYYAFAYAIALTHQPQLCVIQTNDAAAAGHAVVVYRVDGGALYVADPNFPGKNDRKINYREGDLKSYFSGANAEKAAANSTEYTGIGYYGVWRLVNKERAAVPWLALSEGKDPGVGLFPPDFSFYAVTGQDNGIFKNSNLSDGLTVYTQDLAALEDGENGLMIYPKSSVQGDLFTYYNGTVKVDEENADGEWPPTGTIPLHPGENDIGIRVMRLATWGTVTDYGFINFYRFRVTLAEGKTAASVFPSIIVAPEDTTATTGQSVSFAALAEGLPASPVFVWDFGDGQETQTAEPAASHAYTDPGKYIGNVSLADSSDPSHPLAQAEFVVTVFMPENTASAQPTASAVPAGWTVLLENAGEVTEAKYQVMPAKTPPEAGVTNTVIAPGAGQLRITVEFASSMDNGPRFYGDELGYRSQAIVYIRPAGGDNAKQQFYNGYDKNYDTVMLEVAVQTGQAVEIQIVPQGMTCYPETWTPASDGNGYMYVPGHYKLLVEFQ